MPKRSPDQTETDLPPTRGPPRRPGDFLVVGIGASAGGLDACRKLVEALPVDNGMAFILVQHLDPTHESMMVELLASHTVMTVRQAGDEMPIEPDHLYIIPPGVYLSVANGALRLSRPQARHGARLPFDFLLHALAEDCGPRAVCVILSGMGADGSLGLKVVKDKGGLVVAQAPEDAGYEGMPLNAIQTGAVDLVLPVAEIPGALVRYDRRLRLARAHDDGALGDGPPDWLPGIIELLRVGTAHDFTLYKPGTPRRRIERRMAMAAIGTDDMDRYLDLLRADAGELARLAKDLLINVTGFFRDPQVFDLLAEAIIPELIHAQPPGQSLRVWIAGCSTGEETWSVAMLLHEHIAARGCKIKLQIFASDADPDAVATAREGFYPASIAAEVSPTRLARLFLKEDHGYRVSPELRAAVVFTVQDVLTDPPFSNLNLISCRNLLIYLQPEAQAKVISLFHFALRDHGVLVLGTSEAIGDVGGRFEAIAKSERLYRRIGRRRPEEYGLSRAIGERARAAARQGKSPAPTRQATLAELCRRLVLESYAPAAILVDANRECVYFLGPTDRYLRMPPGHPTRDVLAMARPGLRAGLGLAIERARQENARVAVSGRINADGEAMSCRVDVQPVSSDGEEFSLICFVDEPKPERLDAPTTSPRDIGRVAELEGELEATRAELRHALREAELASEEQKAIDEEALSIREEYQSTNEELLASKEELQSLNEELTALNGQLHETLERQRTTANDLQNVLYSTDVATVFLDANLKIRLFTPATRALFSIIPSDVGRPLADLNALAVDGALLTDAGTVLRTRTPIEREIAAPGGVWYNRRILRYRTPESGVEGVVITFTDITERRRVSEALGAAKRQAELATTAKSRFLAAASHDLRQPLQTLTLIQGLLAKIVEEEGARKLVGRLNETVDVMSGMLNALLDINQIEEGAVHAERVPFPVDDLLARSRDEFNFHAQARGLTLRVVPCGVWISSDSRLLERMIGNLLSNALKYTRHGKVLLGCRRRQGRLDIEIWDTGIGIPGGELQAIFEEYHQLDNPARERGRGLGLGLAIVRRLGDLLGHRVRVRSNLGKGSVFVIETPLAETPLAETPLAEPSSVAVAPPPRDGAEGETEWKGGSGRRAVDDRAVMADHQTGAILVVEDDPILRELLELLLKGEGHRVATAPDGVVALELVASGAIQPDLILADYNLPNGMNGLEVTTRLRENLRRDVPVIILTGDISIGALRDIALQNHVRLEKPVEWRALRRTVQEFLVAGRPVAPTLVAPVRPDSPVVFVVDDDDSVRGAIRAVLEDDGRSVEDFAACEDFLEAYRPGRDACLLIDAYLPGMTGLELLARLREGGDGPPAVMITANADVGMAVQAMKAGALDFIEKPVGREELLASVARAFELSRDTAKLSAWHEDAASRVAHLTQRQRQIMEMVLAGHPSKNIAADLGISQRTVENHRAAIMRKTASKSLPALARLALAAGGGDAPPEGSRT